MVAPVPVWPLLGLRVRVGTLDLRPVDDADQAALAALVPADLELDPAATRYPGIPVDVGRELIVRQTFWAAYGTWSAAAWHLHFAVRHDGRLIGEQELSGDDFPTLRTVDTSSWLVADARGAGIGRQMRRAVLAVAFGPLGALAAVSSAWPDNLASLGVSRALGYRPNGEHLHVRGDGLDTMTHVRLTRADWLARGLGDDVVIEGFERCRPLFSP